jgi:LysM repeat protein
MRTSTKLLLFFASLACLVSLSPTFPVRGESSSQFEFHTVTPGDTWSSIALRYLVTEETLWRSNGVINPGRLAPGQRLFIPEGRLLRYSIRTFTVNTASSLTRAAYLSGAAPIFLVMLNDLGTAAAYGQVISAPDLSAAVAVAVTPTVDPSPSVQPTPLPPTRVPENALSRSLLGVQGFFFVESAEHRQRLLDMVAYEAGFGWVKQQIRWDEFEYLPGQYNQDMLAGLDAFMQDAFQRDLRILLSISTAPDWARSTTEQHGPPVNYTDYANFVWFIVDRYKYRLSAIEIWNEPNLQREWYGAPLNGAEYVRLLAAGYEAVKSAYPEGNLTVVSAGLAPTGVNDGVTAVDDRTFLRQMYEAGFANYTDVIGIHPYSWGNPPWTSCCGDWGGAPSHNDHRSFFFLNTIEDYRAIQAEYGDSGRQLWATEFGWGSMDGLGRPVPADAPFYNYVNKDQQAEYILSAFRMGQSWDFMGPMFLWNLNVATFADFDDSQAAYSILAGSDAPRPAYTAIRNVPKTGE